MGVVQMAKFFTFPELRENYKNMYLIVEVAERNEKGFANRFSVLKNANSKREIEKEYESIKENNPDAFVHQTFRDSKQCFRYKTIDGTLQKVSAYSAEECATMFRNYYGVCL